MATISINFDQMNQAIAYLSGIHECSENLLKNPPNIQGGGRTAMELEEIEKILCEVNNQFASLVATTIFFLKKTNNQFMTVDQIIATNVLSN